MIIVVLLFSIFSLTIPAVEAQTPAAPYRAPRMVGTQTPDLNGIWQAFTTANWNLEPHEAGPSAFPALLGAMDAVPPGQGVVEGGQIPYQPWALEKRKENF